MLKNALRAHFSRDMICGKTVHFFEFLTSEMDSATSNYVKTVVHSFGSFHELNLFDSVIVEALHNLTSAQKVCAIFFYKM